MIHSIIRNGCLAGDFQGTLRIGRDRCARSLIIGIGRNHDVIAVWQRLAPHGFPRLAPHNHRMRHRERLEMLHVLGKMPRHLTAVANSFGPVRRVRLRPNKIHPRTLGFVIAIEFVVFLFVLEEIVIVTVTVAHTPGKSGLGFMMVRSVMTVMLHIVNHSLGHMAIWKSNMRLVQQCIITAQRRTCRRIRRPQLPPHVLPSSPPSSPLHSPAAHLPAQSPHTATGAAILA